MNNATVSFRRLLGLAVAGCVALGGASFADTATKHSESAACAAESDAATERPDARALYIASLQNAFRMHGEVTPSAPFLEGVQEVVEALEQGKPITLTAHGYAGEFSDFNREYGLPQRNLGCEVTDVRPFRKNVGMRAALDWYAARGKYPANSLKAQIGKNVPTQLEWNPLAEGDPDSTAMTPLLYLSPAEFISKENYSYRTVMLRFEGKSEKIRSIYVSPAPLSKWAYDSCTQTYWIDAVHTYTPEDSFRPYYIDSQKISGDCDNCPSNLKWQRITSSSASRGLFVQETTSPFPNSPPRVEVHFNTPSGMRVLGSWPTAHRWQTCFWAYDEKEKIAWVKCCGAITDRKILQVHAPSKKVMTVFTTPPEESELQAKAATYSDDSNSMDPTDKGKVVGKYVGTHR